MKRTRSAWLALSLLAAFLAAGIPYWLVPYSKASLPSTLLHPGLIVAGIAALLSCMYGVASFWRSSWMTALAVAAAVGARVVVGVAQDSTSHNLWPFEIVIALLVGFACAIAGAIVGSLIAWQFPNLVGGGRP